MSRWSPCAPRRPRSTPSAPATSSWACRPPPTSPTTSASAAPAAAASIRLPTSPRPWSQARGPTTSLEYDPAINLNEVRPDRPQQAASSGDSEFPIAAAVVPPAALVGLGLVVAVVVFVVWKVSRRSNTGSQPRRPSLTDHFSALHQGLASGGKPKAYTLNRENWITAGALPPPCPGCPNTPQQQSCTPKGSSWS